ncbi:hypothetical protein FCM35_KLT03931 [Carex littledalei]|uniref:Uncharacterized protein n=1 Tax=Carex littledalei TaxID=544730 RepID=A0A833R1I5_9POAL|nr:hypothetical protein FCM35_KLT03931 [Carex littledalei]
MNRTQIGILEQSNKVRLRHLLQRRYGGALEPQIRLEILHDFSDEPLKWELPDQKLNAFLVLPDLTKSNCVWLETVRLLDAAGCRSRFAGRLGGELLAGSLRWT